MNRNPASEFKLQFAPAGKCPETHGSRKYGYSASNQPCIRNPISEIGLNTFPSGCHALRPSSRITASSRLRFKCRKDQSQSAAHASPRRRRSHHSAKWLSNRIGAASVWFKISVTTGRSAWRDQPWRSTSRITSSSRLRFKCRVVWPGSNRSTVSICSLVRWPLRMARRRTPMEPWLVIPS